MSPHWHKNQKAREQQQQKESGARNSMRPVCKTLFRPTGTEELGPFDMFYRRHRSLINVTPHTALADDQQPPEKEPLIAGSCVFRYFPLPRSSTLRPTTSVRTGKSQYKEPQSSCGNGENPQMTDSNPTCSLRLWLALQVLHALDSCQGVHGNQSCPS